MTAIDVCRLTKDFGSFRAVNDLTFTVPSSSVTGFVGANGSGKTTAMRMMLGLLPPTAGSAQFSGDAYAELAEPRRRVGAVVDRLGAHPSHTARDHLTMIAAASGIDSARVDIVLTEVGLADVADKALRKYSMGMRQRCALAAALLGDPPVLVLDEPANGLDPAGIRWLRDKIRDWGDEGRAVLVSSHQLAELSMVTDRLIVLHEGRLRFDGPVQALTSTGGSIEDAVFDLIAGADLDEATR